MLEDIIKSQSSHWPRLHHKNARRLECRTTRTGPYGIAVSRGRTLPFLPQMPFHVSLSLDDVITGHIGFVAPKACHAPPCEPCRSIRAEPGLALRFIRDPVRGRHGRPHGCVSCLSATFPAAQIGLAAFVACPVLAGVYQAASPAPSLQGLSCAV
jgi:hypothetical protein